MPVNTPHPEYSKNLPRWEIVRDCVEGASAIKSRSGGGEGNMWAMPGARYLPPPNPSDFSPENQSRFKAYVTRASFVNFVGFTKDGMIGMTIRVAPEITLPPSLEYLRTNINGDGLFFEQMIIDAMGENLECGRYGLLADYPPAPPGLTKAQVEARGLSATIKPYTAENIINWRTGTIGSKTVLSLVVLCEQVDEPGPDGFGVENKKRYRVLKLVDGVYMQDVYDHDLKLTEADITPKQSNGKSWDLIPFVVIGAQNNDVSVDKGPLYDIAQLNIAHYRNSADDEESSFMMSQPWPVITGLTQSWVKDVLKGEVMVGSRTAGLFPEGSDAKLLQAAPNTMASGGMERKEKQMIMIGARIIQDTTGTETMEAAKIRFAGQNSKLGQIVTNTENGFLKALEWVSLFMGNTGKYALKLNRNFYEATADPQLIVAMMQSLDRGVIAMSDIRDKYRKVGLLSTERTDQQIDSEAEITPPGV